MAGVLLHLFVTAFMTVRRCSIVHLLVFGCGTVDVRFAAETDFDSSGLMACV